MNEFAEGWATPVRWNAQGRRLRSRRRRGRVLLESPYMPHPEIVEREAGSPLSECFCCHAERECITEVRVRFDDKSLVPIEVCATCRKVREIYDDD